MRQTTLCAVIAAVALSCSGVRASLTILKSDGNPASAAEATKVYNPVTGGWDITLLDLYAPGLFTEYNIHGDAGETIDNVIIDVPCLEDTHGDCLIAGSPVIVRIISDPPGGVSSVENVLQTGTAETILSDVDVTQDIGAVEVESIGILRAGRDVLGPIIATNKDNPNKGINTIEAQRHILGDIKAENGRIVLILAYGSIGTQESPVKLHAKHRIVQIASYDWIWSDVNTRVNGGAGYIYKISTYNFSGSFEAEKVDYNPYNGKAGNIEFLDHFEGTVTIGKSFDDPNHRMTLPPAGLMGQIIINADSVSGGTWSAPVHIGPVGEPGSVTLTGPDYTQTAAEIGGGSVGLVPFSLHEQSCDPISGETVLVGTPPEPVYVKLRQYGPVMVNGTDPLFIERRQTGSTGSFTDVPLDAFDISSDPTDANTILVGPAPGETGFEDGYEYRITPTDQLRCDVLGSPAVQWHSPYYVSIEGAKCPADIDSSGEVDVLDLLTMLGQWGPAFDSPADIDSSGTVDVTDLLILLGAWGPC